MVMRFPEGSRGMMNHLEDWIEGIRSEIPDGKMRFPEGARGKMNNPEDYIKGILGEIPEDTKGKRNSQED